MSESIPSIDLSREDAGSSGLRFDDLRVCPFLRQKNDGVLVPKVRRGRRPRNVTLSENVGPRETIHFTCSAPYMRLASGGRTMGLEFDHNWERIGAIHPKALAEDAKICKSDDSEVSFRRCNLYARGVVATRAQVALALNNGRIAVFRDIIGGIDRILETVLSYSRDSDVREWLGDLVRDLVRDMVLRTMGGENSPDGTSDAVPEPDTVGKSCPGGDFV